MFKHILISNGSIGICLDPVTRFVPYRTLCWRHIYDSSKTSHCDLLLVPALLFCHLLQLISPSELCTARGVSLNVPSWTSCGCSTHTSVIDHLRTTDPAQDNNLNLVMVLSCIRSPSKNFRVAK